MTAALKVTAVPSGIAGGAPRPAVGVTATAYEMAPGTESNSEAVDADSAFDVATIVALNELVGRVVGGV